MAADIAANLTVGLLTPFLSRSIPCALGEMERSMKVAVDYGQRLDVGKLKAQRADTLLSDYAVTDL